VDALSAAGVDSAYSSVDNPPAGLLRFEGANGIEYHIGFTNFYKIMTYNPSKLYAMAVFQLSQLPCWRPRCCWPAAARRES